MKNFLFFGVIAAIAALAFAFAPDVQTTTPQPYVFNAPQDTITNTGVRTIVIGGGDGTNFLSNFEGAVFLSLTQNSGTTSIAAVVDEGFVYSNGTTYWVLGKDTITISGAGVYVRELGSLVGRKYRVRLTGSSTHNTTYRLQFTAKPQ